MKFVIILGLLLLGLSGKAHPAWGIVVDEHRNIYFADIQHHDRGAVWKLSPAGELTLLLTDFHAHNVSLDAAGLLVTAHGEENHTMIRLNTNDVRDTLIHHLDHNTFFGGNCTFSPDGKILFGIGHHFWYIDERGSKQKLSDHYFAWNQTIYADIDGYVYGADIGTGNGTLIEIAPDGTSTVLAENLITLTNGSFDPHRDVLLGITKDDRGFLYIAETGGARIVKIIDKNRTETFYSSEPGWIPTGINFHDGDAYILEFGTDGRQGPRIIKINRSGKISVLFDFEEYQKQSKN